MKYIATVKDQEFTIEIDHDGQIRINDEPYEVDYRRLPSGGVTSLIMNHRSLAAVVEERSDHWEVLIQGELYPVQVQDERAYRLSRLRSTGLSLDGEAIVSSPMPGIIVAVTVTEGQAVRLGDKVVILESMKMENELRAPCDGVVTHVYVSTGAGVDKDQVLVVISQDHDEPEM
jgi:biotin carboxyl carrier protein